MTKIPLSFLPLPTGSQGGGPGKREAELVAILLFGTTDNRTRESKVVLFCEKFGGICTMVSRNINVFAYKLLNRSKKTKTKTLKYKKSLLTDNPLEMNVVLNGKA